MPLTLAAFYVQNTAMKILCFIRTVLFMMINMRKNLKNQPKTKSFTQNIQTHFELESDAKCISVKKDLLKEYNRVPIKCRRRLQLILTSSSLMTNDFSQFVFFLFFFSFIHSRQFHLFIEEVITKCSDQKCNICNIYKRI